MSSSKEEIMAMIEILEGQLKALKKALKGNLKGARKSKAVEVDADGNPVAKAKRPLNAWQAWTKHILVEYAEEYAEFSAAQESRRGVAIKFAKHLQETKETEFAAFKAAFVPVERDPGAEPAKPVKPKKEKVEKVEKPAKKEKKAVGGAGAAAPVSDSDSSDSETEAKPAPKKEKVEKPAKKAEKPVKASAAAPAPAPKKAVGGAGAAAPPSDSESDEDELVLKKWVFRGKTYYRSDENDCWRANDDGSMGAWAGKYDPVADKIDDTAEEPESE